MKKSLKGLVEGIMKESSTAEQAKAMGLKYAGYGKWKDASGKTVAKTVQGNLVKLDGTEAPEAGTEGGESPASPNAVPAETQPMVDTGIERLVQAAGGDTMKVKKTLAKRFHAAKDEESRAKAQGWLDRLDKYDTMISSDVKNHAQQIQDKEAERQAALKAKYASKYPSPQI
jgi:hypothetical protein